MEISYIFKPIYDIFSMQKIRNLNLSFNQLNNFIMKTKITNKFYIFMVAILMTMSTGINAQDFTYNVPGDYLTIRDAFDALTANDNITAGANVTINISEGEFTAADNSNIIINPGMAINLIIQGAGADKTTIMPDPTKYRTERVSEGDGTGIARFVQLNNNSNEGLNLTIKDLKLKYWGFHNTHGGVINVKADANITVSLINCEFEALGARAGAIMQSMYPKHEILIDNCYFHNNLAFARDQKQGILNFETPGKITIKNSLFMSNDQDPIQSVKETRTEDGEWLTGGVITVKTTNHADYQIENDMNILLENNAFINNLPHEEALVDITQPTMSIKHSGTEELIPSVYVEMIDNIFIGNKRDGENNDVDIFFNNEKIEFINSSGNIVNSLITLDADSVHVDAQVEGFKVSSGYTYSDSRIGFEMDGELPIVKFDSNGVGYVDYSGDGGTPTFIESEKQLNNIQVYSQNNRIHFNGLTPNTYLQIYSISGSLVHKQKINSAAQTIPLKKGMYIAIINNEPVKIIHY